MGHTWVIHPHLPRRTFRAVPRAAEGRGLVEVIEDAARLGARLIIQTAVEAEVDAFLGRARYQRAAAVTSDDEQQAVVRPGYRNGHCPTTVKTISGPVTIHKCRNVLSKVSAGDQAEVKAAYWDTFTTSSLNEQVEPGQPLVEWVQRRIDVFADTWGARYPAAVKSLLTDRASLTTYLRFLPEHHKRIRHSNFIERTFGETRRRVKVIGRFPGETSCVSLLWAVLDRAACGWRGFTMTSKSLRTLQDLRRALLFPPTQLHPTTAPATDSTPKQPPPNINPRHLPR
ncbi:transposase [Microbispora sp. NPDC049125]|uniref:transposase n=1 Tax=Microbispora sp. NPDC049125 TaxID=3154929 RepID=UPI0034656DEE